MDNGIRQAFSIDRELSANILSAIIIALVLKLFSLGVIKQFEIHVIPDSQTILKLSNFEKSGSEKIP